MNSQHELQPLAEDQSETHYAERRDPGDQDGEPEVAVVEQGQVDQRGGAAALSPNEPDSPSAGKWGTNVRTESP